MSIGVFQSTLSGAIVSIGVVNQNKCTSHAWERGISPTCCPSSANRASLSVGHSCKSEHVSRTGNGLCRPTSSGLQVMAISIGPPC